MGMIDGLRVVPQQRERMPACATACAAGGDVRGWIGVIAQRRKLRLSDTAAYARAWNVISGVNPFPATLGRICPHPCESACSRNRKDGAVAINALERFLGDWALRERLPLPILTKRRRNESIGVVGAGPAGLSFAYQMARRGYRVTVYEKGGMPGGMLASAVPSFRLPAGVLQAEIERIVALGVELRTGAAIGRDISTAELRRRHRVIFVAIGAGRGIALHMPGEPGERAMWLGVDYLSAIKRGASIPPASQVVVIGGGNTALDAARAARRRSANVTILYRRTAAEMPASASEIAATLAEGVMLECLSSAVAIERRGGGIAVVAQRMRPPGAGASRRLPPVPLANSEFTVPADCVIVALSQQPDWSGLEAFRPKERLDVPRVFGSDARYILAGGDILKPGIAARAILHGRTAAEAAYAKLNGLPNPRSSAASTAEREPRVKPEYYARNGRVCVPSRPVEQRLLDADAEVIETLSAENFLGEVTRCFSCGLCFGCRQCFMYCNAGAISVLEGMQCASPFAVDLDSCEGCGKCIELCPCGFLSATAPIPSNTGVRGYVACPPTDAQPCLPRERT